MRVNQHAQDDAGTPSATDTSQTGTTNRHVAAANANLPVGEVVTNEGPQGTHREAEVLRRRNERNGAFVTATCDIESLRAAAAAHGAMANTAELGVEELVQVFGRADFQSAHALAQAARVCRLWRTAASHLRRDLLWQLEHLAVINGVPEQLLMPHSAEELKAFVVRRPREAVAFLSINQLRAAGASQAMIAERLDYDDGILFHVATSRGVDKTESSSKAKSTEAVAKARSALLKMLSTLGDRGESEYQLPIKCTLEATAKGVQVMVADLHVGFVPESFVPTVALGEARITHLPYPSWRGPLGNWKARAIPAE